jgi:hypothetical protein
MESVVSKSSNRIELRVVHSLTTALDAWMTVSHEGQVISCPVRTQLGAPLSVIVGDNTISLRHGKLFLYDGGQVSPPGKSAKKKQTYGLVHYLANVDVDLETQEQFHVKLYLPTESYKTIWDMGSRGNLPRLIQLQVKGLRDDSQWDITDVGAMLLVDDFSFSYAIDTHGLYGPA